MGAGKPWPQITQPELESRIAQGQLLLLVDDRVYDATDYLYDHPGGAGSIAKRADGRTNCKRDYEFHSSNAHGQWTEHQVAVLVKTRKPDAPTLPPFRGDGATPRATDDKPSKEKSS